MGQLFCCDFRYTVSKPRLHTVASAHYRNTQDAMRQLFARGYRRIGLAVNGVTDARCDHNVYASYLAEQALSGCTVTVPPFFDFTIERPDMLHRWVQRYQPDAILTSDFQIMGMLEEIGLRAPEEIGVACMTLPEDDGVLSGVIEDSEKIGAVAVDFLVAMIQRNERGIPSAALRSHLEGRWTEGTTLRPRLDMAHSTV